MHTFTKKVTFAPLSRGRYRCNQTGQVMTRKQILAYVSDIVAGGSGTTVIAQAKGAPPKKSGGQKHPSKYRTKHR